MVEKFPLAKANEAFGNVLHLCVLSLLTVVADAMMRGTVRFRAVITMD